MSAAYAELIRKRKSFRSFRQEPLPDSEIDALVDFLSDLTPPESEIDWNFDTLPYLDRVKLCSSEPGVKAPHYLILRAERKQFSLQNCGYLGEKAVLYLTEKGIATCWQGSVRIEKDHDFEGSLPFVSAFAFGYSDEPFRSENDPVDRKPADKVIYNRVSEYQPILELGRLAPSSFNRQPCVFVSDDRQRLHVFRKKGFFANPVSEFAQCVDAGAAMAHLELGAVEAGYSPKIERLYPAPSFKHGLVYQASIILGDS